MTAADGTDAYTLENNAARTETPEQAIELDRKTLAAWHGAERLRIIDNSTDFSQKITRVLEEVLQVVDEPIPHEIERKFLIKRPTAEFLSNATQVDITQTYLTEVTSGTERRVRARHSSTGGTAYYLTEKTRFGEGDRLEKERSIGDREYLNLLREADPICKPIHKFRYVWTESGHYFELDVYPEFGGSSEFAILEVELPALDAEFEWPEGIESIKEVTSDKEYSNASLARNGWPNFSN